MTATTPYLLRAGARGQHTWLQYLIGSFYRWCPRKAAKRYVGRPAAEDAAEALRAAMAAKGYGHVPVAIVPAGGGMACHNAD